MQNKAAYYKVSYLLFLCKKVAVALDFKWRDSNQIIDKKFQKKKEGVGAAILP